MQTEHTDDPTETREAQNRVIIIFDDQRDVTDMIECDSERDAQIIKHALDLDEGAYAHTYSGGYADRFAPDEYDRREWFFGAVLYDHDDVVDFYASNGVMFVSIAGTHRSPPDDIVEMARRHRYQHRPTVQGDGVTTKNRQYDQQTFTDFGFVIPAGER